MTLEEHIARALEVSMRQHPTRAGRAALRCALGDAAAICNLIARQAEAQNQGRRKGSVSEIGAALSATAKLCGDKIWAMRADIKMDDVAP